MSVIADGREARARAPHLFEPRSASAKGRALRTVFSAVTGTRRLPGFLILGEKRCGTTSLHRYITEHPNVLGPLAPKSTHYFDTRYSESLDWYKSYFWPEPLVQRMERRRGPMLSGESSPYYFFHPAAASRIAETLPEIRVLVLMREPGSRAWSNFQYERDKGNETLGFDEAIAAESKRIAGEEQRLLDDDAYVSHAHRTFSYVARGRYHEHLMRLYQSIDEQRVHVVCSEELYTDTQRVMAGVHEFLDLEHVPIADTSAGRANVREPAPVEALDRIRAELMGDTENLYAHLGRRLWAS
ncbi:MAG: sulfotransferase [Acidimicrobiales bacterium]|nr:sulfotransferase [Acidimicrobiales bacterium]